MAEIDYKLDTAEGVRYAVTSLLRFRREVEEMRLPVALYEMGELKKEMGELKDEVRALRRTLYMFAFSVAGSAIVFAFTVFALLGRHP